MKNALRNTALVGAMLCLLAVTLPAAAAPMTDRSDSSQASFSLVDRVASLWDGLLTAVFGGSGTAEGWAGVGVETAGGENNSTTTGDNGPQLEPGG